MKYFLDRDSDGHWYIVEASHRDGWKEWLSLGEDDPISWEVPSFASIVEGHPSKIEFFLEKRVIEGAAL